MKTINKEHFDLLLMFKKERSHAEDKLNISLGILFFSLTFVATLFNQLGWTYFISLIVLIILEILFVVIFLLPEFKYKRIKHKYKSIDGDFNIYSWQDWTTYNKNEIQIKYDIDLDILKQIMININIIRRKYLAFQIFASFMFIDMILIIIFLCIKNI
ncbi:MAG: hypothetical protein ACRC8C_02780 [Mycoplasmoidaceae bacterium]